MKAFGRHRKILLSGCIYDAEGRVIADANSERASSSMERDLFGIELVESDTTVFEWKSDRLVAGRVVTVGNQRTGAVSVALSTEPLQVKVTSARNQGFLVAMIVIAIGLFLGLLVSRSITKPMKKMVVATKYISRGELDHRVTVNSSDELALLADSFNMMTEELQQMMARKAAILESALDCIITLDKDGKIIELNPSAEETFGYRRTQAIGHDFTALLLSSHEGFSKDVMNYLATGEGTLIHNRTEVTAKNAEGREFPVELTISHIKIDEPLMFTVVARDITERKRSEADLRTQKELIDRILATMPNAVLVLSKDLRIVLSNRAFNEAFEMKKHEVEGKRLDDILPVEELCQAVSKVLTGKELNLQFDFRHEVAGHDKVLVASVIPMQKNEALLILNDVTDERERQERLYLTDRLASVGEMASGVAHELNNPLTGVITMSQLLAEDDMSDDAK
jgi:PAS domain S-box-containing protein